MEKLILGLILAGGRSSRMGREKAFASLNGEPLMWHAVRCLTPQVGRVVINANGNPTRFQSFGLAILPDLPGLNDAGPLGGVLAGLHHARIIGSTHLATLPCDAPFAPADLVAGLAGAARPDHVAMAMGPQGLEPAFALWPTHGIDALETAIANGERSLRGAAAALGEVMEVAFSADSKGEDPFANLNNPEDLAAAEARFTSQ